MKGLRAATAVQLRAWWILYGEPSAPTRAVPASPVPSDMVAVPDRRLAEALVALADAFDDYNSSTRRDAITRVWIAFPELGE